MTVLLNLGCGGRYHQDWVNLDVSPADRSVRSWDIQSGLPFGERSVDAIYCAHVLEHLEPAAGRALIQECARVSKSGGIIRFGVPDLEQLAILYLSALRDCREGLPGASDRYEWAVMELIDQLVRHRSGGLFVELFSRDELPVLDHAIMRWGAEAEGLRSALVTSRSNDSPRQVPSMRQKIRRRLAVSLWSTLIDEQVGKFRIGGEPHLWMYDSFSLSELFKSAGFINVREMPLMSSRIKGWDLFALEGVDQPFKPDTVVVEGMAP